MKEILHIAGQSHFLKHAIRLFEEVAPGWNDYFVYNHTGEINNEHILSGQEMTELYKSSFSSFTKYKAVVIHSLTPQITDIVLQAPKHVNYVWIAWGGDFYRVGSLRERLYTQKTKAILRQQAKQTNYLKYLLQISHLITLYGLVVKQKLPRLYKRKLAIRRMKTCAPVIKEDYDLLVKHLGIKAMYAYFNYFSIEDVVDGDIQDLKPLGSNILLGNSADYGNNHLDMLELLSKSKFKDQVICPLSYGYNWYRDFVLRKSNGLLGERFKPLTEFLEKEAYNQVLQSCGYVIMNHRRQQASGNILTMIWHGAKIFLSEDNPIYHFFKRLGVIVFSIENDLERELANYSHLSQETILLNRECILREFSEDRTKEKARRFVNQIISD